MRALGGDPQAFTFAHFPLIVDQEGHGKCEFTRAQKQNLHPLAVISVLAALGTDTTRRLETDLKAFANAFDFQKFGRASPKLDVKDLWAMNKIFFASFVP